MKADILDYVFTQEEILVLVYKLIEKLHEITEEVNELQAQQSKDNETKLADMRVELEEFARQIGVFAQNTKNEQDRLVGELEKLDEVVEAKVSDAGADIDAAVDSLEDRIEALRAEIPVLKEKTGSELMSLIGTIPFDRVEGLAEIARQLNSFSEVVHEERSDDSEFVKGEIARVEERIDNLPTYEDKFKELNADMYKLSQELVNITPRIEVFVDGNKYASVHRLNFVGSTVTNDNGLVTVTNVAGDGTGDVTGPASSTDNAFARFDGATGKIIQNSNATLSDDGAASIDAVQFDLTPTTTVASTGMTVWNPDEGTLDLGMPNGVTQQIGQETFFYVKNQTGGTLTNGKPVMFAGALGASGRLKAQYAIADGTLQPHYTMGILTQDIANGADGYVTWFGKVRGIDTTGTPYGEVWSEGDRLYVSDTVAGALTNVAPNAPSYQISVAAVVSVHATQGVLFVRPTWRGKLTELDDVNGTPLTTTGQIMVWDNTAGYFDFTANINDYSLTSHNHTGTYAPVSHVHVISDVTGLQTALDGKVDENVAITGATKTKITYDAKGLVTSGADATTADIADSLNKRYVTDANLTVIGNTSGTNTGDETQSTIKTKLGAATASVDGYATSTQIAKLDGIAAGAEVNVNADWNAVSGDAQILNKPTIPTQYTDEMAQDAVGGMVDTTLVYTDATPALSRAALTGAITASAGSNTTALGSFTKSQLDGAVSDGNVLYVGDVTSNATHTGEVTGATALTVDKTAIANKTLVTAAVGDHVLIADASDSDNLKKVTVQTIIDLASGGIADGDKGDITVTGGVWNIDAATIGTTELSATGTPSSSTYLRGDNTWATIAGGGDVVGPASATDNAIARFDSTTGKLIQNSGATIDDNGTITTMTGTASAAPIVIPAGTLKSTPADGDIEMDADALYACTDAGNRGVIPVEHIIRADATRTFTSNTTQQAIFTTPANGTLTLETGTYLFEGLIAMTSMSATSGNGKFSLIGAGTATLGDILWQAYGNDNTAETTGAATGGSWHVIATQTAANIATAATGTALAFLVKGTFTVTVAGTIIPSFAQTTAAAAVVSIGSYFRCNRIGSTSVTSVGQWT